MAEPHNFVHPTQLLPAPQFLAADTAAGVYAKSSLPFVDWRLSLGSVAPHHLSLPVLHKITWESWNTGKEPEYW